MRQGAWAAAAAALLLAAGVWCPRAAAQGDQGYVSYASGPPVRTTYIVPPANSPYAAPAYAPAYAPGVLPAVDYGAKEAFSIGPCTCLPTPPAHLLCFVNETIVVSANATSTECDAPRAFKCTETPTRAGEYAQLAGVAWNCSLTTPSPAYASSPRAGQPLPVLPGPAAAPVNDGNYTGVFQPNATAPAGPGDAAPGPAAAVRYARTPVLQAGQELSIDPAPPSVGLHFAGSDITMNGQLNGIPLEPPNPAICVGNGFVLEVTNDVLIVYSAEDGSVLAGPTDFQHFFGVIGPPNNGLSDPYCLYDATDSKRFFVSISQFSCRTAACLAKQAVRVHAYMLIGVSRTSDPRDGFLGPYFVPTDAINPQTNEPYPGFGDCGRTPSGFTGKGCLGDFPNPALDANGFWFSMNMFTIDADNLIGANVFGVRKADLLSGRHINPSVVTYTDWAPYPGFTIMLSITQATWRHSPAQGGSIFLVSSDSFSYTGQRNDSLGIPSLRTWAITNTSLLGQGFPGGASPRLSPPVTLPTQALQFTTTALYNPRAPSRTSVPQPSGPILGGQDERLRQVSFSGGYLYTCLNTPVQIASRTYNGLAFFVLAPNFTADGRYTARIVDQGYVGVPGANLLNGALTATANGSAVITGSIVGTGMYLSAFYAHITPQAGPGPVHAPHISTNPLMNEGPGQLPQRRTGDYSVATLDEGGKVWLVAEWASDRYTRLQQPDTKNPRLANWGTYILQVDPNILD